MVEQKVTVNREHKSSLFCDLFSDKGRALSLYNAINGTHHEDPEEMEIVTLQDQLYMHRKNDISILFDAKLTLWEHQSTVNLNMPLRGLQYYVRNIEGIIKDYKQIVYRKSLVKIPTPDYYVMYNGATEQPERMDLHLSDAFQVPTTGYEWTAHVLNINAGYNREIMEQCSELTGYVRLVQYIRDYRAQGHENEEAVDLAIRRCVDEDCLAEYLTKLRREAHYMSMWTEFDEEAYEQGIREDAYEEGREEGREKGREEGALLYILDRREDGVDDEVIRERLIRRFSIPPEKADEYLRMQIATT